MIDNYLKNPQSEFFQIISAFILGLLFGPLSLGIFYSLLFIFIYEFFLFYYTKNYPGVYKLQTRIYSNIFGIYGWIIGRYLLLGETGFEFFIK